MLKKDIDLNITGYDAESPAQLRVIGTREALSELAAALLDCLESPEGETTKLSTGPKGELGFVAIYMKQRKKGEPQKSFSERLHDIHKAKKEEFNKQEIPQ